LDQIHSDPTHTQAHTLPQHVIGTKDLLPDGSLPFIDPDQFIGHAFKAEHAGTLQRIEVESKEDDQYHVEYADGNEDHLTYEELINLLNKETEDGYHLWTFKEILDHHFCKKNGKTFIEVKVLWDTNEESWEPLNMIKADEAVTVSK